MTTTNAALRIYYKAEAHYGSGYDGGADYTPGDPTEAEVEANYTSFCWLAGKPKLKAKSFKLARLKAAGAGLGALVVTTGVEYPEIEIAYYIQTSDPWFTAVNNTTASISEGACPTSYTLHIEVPDADESGTVVAFEIYGAVPIAYTLEGDVASDKPPFATVRFTCFDMDVNSEDGDMQADDIAMPSAAPQEWVDLVITAGGQAQIEMSKFRYECLWEMTPPKVGSNASWNRLKPLLLDRTATLDLTTSKVLGFNGYEFLEATAATRADVTVIVDMGIRKVTLTNMYIDKDTVLEIENEPAANEWQFTFVTGNSAFTEAAS